MKKVEAPKTEEPKKLELKKEDLKVETIDKKNGKDTEQVKKDEKEDKDIKKKLKDKMTDAEKKKIAGTGINRFVKVKYSMANRSPGKLSDHTKEHIDSMLWDSN